MTENTESKKNNSIYIIAAAVIAVLSIGAGVWAFTNQMQLDSQQPTKLVTAPIPAQTPDQAVSPTMTPEGQDQSSVQPNQPNVQPNQPNKMVADSDSQAGKYVPYTAELVSNQKSDQKVVLFFNASWCPTCQNTIKDINANQGNIPNNLTILSADYDKEVALKQKYGVTMQHTFILVDKDGNLIKKANGLATVKAISDFAI